MKGEIGILSVGAGDTKLTFDKNNPAECIRAARIVKDMLRRGYALLVDRGDGQYQRAIDFDDTKYEYIIADFDPEVARVADIKEVASGKGGEPEAPDADVSPGGGKGRGKGGDSAGPRGRRGPRRVAAENTRAVAVGRTAGG